MPVFVLTLLFALYVLGPDLASRWILGFVAPRRILTQTRGEEISRAIVWAVFPLIFAYLWAAKISSFWSIGNMEDVRTFYSGLSSDSFFNASRPEFFAAATKFIRMNLALIWREYVIVGSVAMLMTAITWKYGSLRSRYLKGRPRCEAVLSSLILPRISYWHILLSPMLIPSRHNRLVDVMTKSDDLFQGEVKEYAINANGDLLSVTLASPKKYKRKELLEARAAFAAGSISQLPNPALFWSLVPGRLFVILGSEIKTLNVQYQPVIGNLVQSKDVAKRLREFAEAAKQKSSSTGRHSSGTRPKQIPGMPRN